jgi:hypothetical protein
MTSESTEVTQVMENDSLRVFLSYSHKDRVIAAAVKKILEADGMDVFLAHEDIEPCAIWIDTIRSSLDGCHVFIPLLTDEFGKSPWTNQELGYCIAKDKIIIPIKVSVDPSGFIHDIQALKLKPGREGFIHPLLGQVGYDYDECASEIIEIIRGTASLIEPLKNGLVNRLSVSKSFAETSRIITGLNRYRDFSRDQINRITAASLVNRQVYCEFSARGFLEKFLVKYQSEIDGNSRQILEGLIRK